MEPDGDAPPFWSPTSTTVLLQHQRRRRRSPPSFLSPVLLILLLPILALIVIFFVISPFLSHATQFLLGPTFSVKKIWDSLNVVLVIFAILCGVFARIKEEVPAATGQNTLYTNGDRPAETILSSQYLSKTASVGPETEIARSSPNEYRATTTFESENQTVGSSQWYDTTPMGPEIETIRSGQWYDTTSIRPDIETIWSSRYRYNTTGVEPENQMRRSSSYPELRQVSLWNEGDSQFWYTNVEVNIYNQSPAKAPAGSDHFDIEGLRGKEDGEDIDDKVIPVDTFEVRSTSFASPLKSTPPPSPPSEPPLNFNQRSFHENDNEVETDRIVETNAADNQLKENSSPLPAPPPPPPASLKQQRSFHSVPRKKKVEKTREVEAEIPDDQIKEIFLPPPAPPSPSPPPPVSSEIEQSHTKPQRKKSGTAKELTNAISSFYNQQKKKKKSKQKIVGESSSESSPPSTHPSLPPQTPPPPPPPVPPPSKVFQNLFKKNSKTKRSQYSETTETTLPLPPPPPPPPNSIFNNMFKTGNRSKRFILASSTGPPPPHADFIPKSSSGPPTSPPPPPPPPSSILTTLFKQGSRSNRFKSESSITRPPSPPPPPKQHISSKRKSKNKGNITPTLSTESVIPGKPPLPEKLSIYSDEYQNSGSQSPLVTNPSPPPLPPFKMPEFEFVASGDFVRIRSSASNSWCSSPGLEDVTDGYSDQMDGLDIIGPSAYCPSPDVNAKADTFISRLKDEWRLEKINSISKIGPKPK